MADQRAYGTAFEVWRDAAREKSELWRLLVGLFVVLAVVLAGNIAIRMVLADLIQEPPHPASEFGSTRATMFLLLFAFGLLTLGVAVACRVLHRRSVGSVLGRTDRVTRDFWAVLRWLVAIQFLLWILLPVYHDEVTPNVSAGIWLVWLLPALLAVLVQTSAEEILFRGYIQQQLAARFNSPLVWAVIPSLLFALGHYMPEDAGQNAVVIFMWAGVFGLLMSDLTARAGNLGPAIACHFANNVSSLLLVSLADGMNGLALYTVPYDLSDPDALFSWMPAEFGVMLVIWLAARVAIRA